MSNDAITVRRVSLKSVFGKLAGLFEKATRNRVECQLRRLLDLVTQLVRGAPADVFASADEEHGQGESTPAGDGQTGHLRHQHIDDRHGSETQRHLPHWRITKPGVTVVICAPQVPCGGAASRC